MRSSSLVAVTLAAAACSAGPSVPTGVATDVSVPASRSATPTSSTTPVHHAAASAASPGDPPPPPMPTGVDPEKFEFVSQICAAALFARDDGKTFLGCHGNPPFDTPKKRPSGRLETDVDPNDLCSLDAVFRGHFTKPDVEQAVLAFGQCTDDDGFFDNGYPGSAVLVERVGARWKVRDHQNGVNLGACQTIRRKSGTAFLCKDGFGAINDGELSWLMLLDFAKPQAGRVAILGRVFSNDFPILCNADFFPPPFLEQDGVTSATLGAPKVADVDADGDDDVTMEVVRVRVPPSKALEKRIWAMCEQGLELVPPSRYVPKAKAVTLEWRGDGDAFVPTPTTEKTLEAWKKESPETWMKLR